MLIREDIDLYAGLNDNASPKEGRELTSILLLNVNLNKRESWHQVSLLVLDVTNFCFCLVIIFSKLKIKKQREALSLF